MLQPGAQRSPGLAAPQGSLGHGATVGGAEALQNGFGLPPTSQVSASPPLRACVELELTSDANGDLGRVTKVAVKFSLISKEAEAVAEELSLLAPPFAGQSLTQRQYIGELRDYVTIRDKLRRVCS